MHTTSNPLILGENPKGFTDPVKTEALVLRTRLQSGENVPLSELMSFLTSASKDLSATVKQKAKKEIQTDVDFF